MQTLLNLFRKKRQEKQKRSLNVEKRALLIGCNYPKTSSQLNGCINDVNAMRNYLTQHGGFHSNEITVLTDDLAGPSNRKPTKHNILLHIRKLTDNLPRNKKVVLFFHYSGHGSYTYDRSGDEDDRRDETICPTDYSRSGLITDDDLKVHLVDCLPENVELYCVMDCCHSGTGLDLRYECRLYGSGRNKEYKVQTNNGTKSAAKVVLLSGCKDAQYSADAYIRGKYQGAMTWGLLEVLKKHNYQPISYKKLLKEVQDLLRNKRYEQIPQLSFGKYEDLKDTFCVL